MSNNYLPYYVYNPYKDPNKNNNNAHGICNIGKVRFLWGTSQTNGWTYDSSLEGYTHEITFDYPFTTEPAVFCSAYFPSGSPAKTSILYKNNSKIKLYCSSGVQGLWVYWLSVSFAE